MEVFQKIRNWQKEGLKIAFTNGVFDILHRGHVTYLNEAKKHADKLVVGVNSDASVRRLGKGPERPINDEQSRAFIIENLRAIDAVLIFDADTPIKLIEEILPDILIKGGDYSPDERDPNSKEYIVGSDAVKDNGGEVIVIDLVKGFSTTGIVQKMNQKNG